MFTYGFYNSVSGDERLYNAEDFNSLFDGIITDGVFANIGTSLVVTPTTGMNVAVGIGKAWFKRTWSLNDAPLPLAIFQSEPLNPRIDTVVLRVYKSLDLRVNQILIVNGISHPTTPVPNNLFNGENDTYDLPLAYILVPANSTSVVEANITNLVGTASCPFVTGPLATIDIDFQYDQWENSFTTWFNTVKGQLTTDQAGNLQTQINNLRPFLKANRTYYVRKDGNDSNTGLSNNSAGAFLTIQKAIDVASQLDAWMYGIYIYVGPGTYAENVILKPGIGGGTAIQIIGNDATYGSDTIIAPATGHCINTSGYGGLYTIHGFKLQTGGAGGASCLYVTNRFELTIYAIDFGSALTGYHIRLMYYSRIVLGSTGYRISGPCALHAMITTHANLVLQNAAISVITNPVAIGTFVHTYHNANVLASGITFANKAYATGAYYNVSLGSIIDTGGGGATYFPGNSAGSVTSPGAYA